MKATTTPISTSSCLMEVLVCFCDTVLVGWWWWWWGFFWFGGSGECWWGVWETRKGDWMGVEGEKVKRGRGRGGFGSSREGKRS